MKHALSAAGNGSGKLLARHNLRFSGLEITVHVPGRKGGREAREDRSEVFCQPINGSK